MKRVGTVVVVLLILATLTACNKGETGQRAQGESPYVEKTENKSEDAIFVVYDLLNGEDAVPFSLSKDMDMLVAVETEAGALDLAIYSREDTNKSQPFLQQEGLSEETAQFLGSLPAGAYTLNLKGTNHKGSYEITFQPR